MTKVIITVEADTGSHFTAAEREISTTYPVDPEEERGRISDLLRRALEKVDQAYGLSQKQCAETPKPVGGAE